MLREMFELYLSCGVIQLSFDPFGEGVVFPVERLPAPSPGMVNVAVIDIIEETMPVGISDEGISTVVHLRGDELGEETLVEVPWEAVLKMAGYLGRPPITVFRLPGSFVPQRD